jgi:integrase
MNIDIKDAMDQYRAHRIAKGKAANTVDNNMQPIKHLWRLVGDIQVASLRPQHFDKLFTQHKWEPATRNLYLGNLKQFVQYCRRMGYMPKDYDPLDDWDNNKVPVKEKLIIPPEEFADLLDAANNPRDRAVLALGLYTFCRSSELVTLRVDDVDFDRNLIRIFRWKTSQPDMLPMCSELKEELLRYMADYGKAVGGLQSGYFLVPSLAQQEMVYDPQTRRLAPSGGTQAYRPTSKIGHPYEMTQRALTKLGYETKQTGGHTLRRSGARALFDQLRSIGYDGALRTVGSMLGHSDTKVTEVYLQVGIERMQRNEMLAGKSMLPDLVKSKGVTRLEAV